MTQNRYRITTNPFRSRTNFGTGRFCIASLVGILFSVFATPSTFAQSDDTADTVKVLTRADSLALADTVQPELRVGFFGGPIGTSAHVKEIYLNPKPRYGFHAGLRAEMEFAYPIYFLVELEYAQKGIRSDFELAPGVMLEEEFHFNYLDIPILYRVGIPIGDRYSFSAGIGAHIALLVSRTRISRIAEIDSTSIVRNGLKQYDVGVEGRLGGEMALSPRWSLTADLRYLHGLTNILILREDIDDRRSWESRSLFFSAGIMYQLQRSIRIMEPTDSDMIN